MRVKSRKPPAENLMTSDLSDVLEIGRGADDGVGDEMRQMRGDRQHHVVMLGVHRHDLHPRRSHSALDLGDRLGSRSGRRRQDAPAVVEQLGETRFRPGMLGARDRMAGDEMHARGQQRRRDRGSPPP